MAEFEKVVHLYSEPSAHEPIPLAPSAVRAFVHEIMKGRAADHCLRNDQHWKSLVAGVTLQEYQSSFHHKLRAARKTAPTNEDVRNAYTIILWLGTSLGIKFLDDALRPGPTHSACITDHWIITNEDSTMMHKGTPMIRWIFHECTGECSQINMEGSRTSGHLILPPSQTQLLIGHAVMSWLDETDGRKFLQEFSRLIRALWFNTF